MKVGLITEMNDTLKFSYNGLPEETFVFHSLDDINIKLEFLIVDNKFVPAESLIKYIDQTPRKMKYVFILSEKNDAIKNTILRNKGVYIIPPMLTRNQVASKVYKILYGGEDGERSNIITFFGADSKVGTSMIAQSVAEKLSENQEIKVLLAILDGSPGMDYIQKYEASLSIDTVRAKVVNHILSDNELIDACTESDNLYILQGTQSLLYRKYYHPEHIEALLLQLANIFDIVVVDGGSNVELGMTIGALNSSRHKFLIVTQQSTCLRHYKQIKSQILSELEIKDFCMIINKYISNGQLYDKNQLSDEYEAPHICSVPYSEFNLQAEIEKRTIHRYQESDYIKAIDEITTIIEDSLGIKAKSKKEPPSFFEKVFKYRRVGAG